VGIEEDGGVGGDHLIHEGGPGATAAAESRAQESAADVASPVPRWRQSCLQVHSELLIVTLSTRPLPFLDCP
jgi:hypothetical protein